MKKVSDDTWWEEEFKNRPDGNRNKIILGNSVKLADPVDGNQKRFKINSTKSFIECVRVMAQRLRKKERTYVVFVNEEQLGLFEE